MIEEYKDKTPYEIGVEYANLEAKLKTNIDKLPLEEKKFQNLLSKEINKLELIMMALHNINVPKLILGIAPKEKPQVIDRTFSRSEIQEILQLQKEYDSSKKIIANTELHDMTFEEDNNLKEALQNLEIIKDIMKKKYNITLI